MLSWNDFDTSTRPIEDCMKYACLINAPGKREELGKRMVSSNRISDLIGQPFNWTLSRVYLGALKADNNDDSFNKWLLKGLVALSEKEWKNILIENKAKGILALVRSLNEIVGFNIQNLDIAITACIKTNVGEFSLIKEAIQAHNAKAQLINDALTESFFDAKTHWTTLIKNYDEEMLRFNWFAYLSTQQRKIVVEKIVEYKAGYPIKLLERFLSREQNPKQFFNRNLNSTRSKLKHNLKLKSYREKYKESARKILALLA